MSNMDIDSLDIDVRHFIDHDNNYIGNLQQSLILKEGLLVWTFMFGLGLLLKTLALQGILVGFIPVPKMDEH